MFFIVKFGDKFNCYKYWFDYFILFILYIEYVFVFN